jgi:hypothetical protein
MRDGDGDGDTKRRAKNNDDNGIIRIKKRTKTNALNAV